MKTACMYIISMYNFNYIMLYSLKLMLSSFPESEQMYMFSFIDFEELTFIYECTSEFDLVTVSYLHLLHTGMCTESHQSFEHIRFHCFVSVIKLICLVGNMMYFNLRKVHLLQLFTGRSTI